MPSNPTPAVPQTADAVIIGGGVIGCAIQYNLARLGVANTVLLERDVLGSGSTGRSHLQHSCNKTETGPGGARDTYAGRTGLRIEHRRTRSWQDARSWGWA